MKNFLIVVLVFWGQSAFAHPGHLIEVAGHDHWLAGAAIGAAIAAGLWGALKGQPESQEAEDQDPEEPQEA